MNSSDLPEKVNRLNQVFAKQANPEDAETKELLSSLSDVITKTVAHMSDNKKQPFSFTQSEKDMLCNSILIAIQKTSARDHAEVFKHLAPEIVNSIEQIMTMLPAPET
ncbi:MULTISPECIES: hypothetical protein [unclassified Endozoicomonas]|uniref:hypothetical protein n=1 Tax=unclassified Endozoicomonas TaxID=2644528 RepID=UPI003BB49F92